MAYSLVFGFRDQIAGEGFLAGVAVNGRALAVEEDGGWTLYGVCPAAVCGTGETLNEAYASFKTTYKTILFQLADESDGYDSFKDLVARFYRERNEDRLDEERWDDAARAVREGRVTPGGAASELPRVDAEAHECTLQMARLDSRHEFTLRDNALDSYELAEAS